MSFLSWLFGKGMAGAISSDLLKKYLAIKSKHPHEEDEKIFERVWNFWLTLNADKIQAEDGIDKIARLSVISEKNDKKTALDSLTALKSLLSLYQDILFIETGITTSDGRLWDNSMKVLVNESKKYGLDFSKEYESLKRIRDSAI